MRTRIGLYCCVVAGAVIVLSGCATTADSHAERNISLERVSSQKAKVTHADLTNDDGVFSVRGELTKRYLMRGPIPGHLHVAVVDASGKVLSDTPTRYMRKSAKSRKAPFYLKLPVEPPQGSTVRISHHGMGHGQPGSG